MGNLQQNPPYTVEQLQLALTVVAEHATTLTGVLMSLQEQFGKHQDLCAHLGAVKCMVDVIGGIADDAMGGDVAGDMRYWIYGPLFAEHGLKAEPGGQVLSSSKVTE